MKIAVSIFVVIFLLVAILLGLPEWNRFKYVRALARSKDLCASYKVGDPFVENDFDIRAVSRNLARVRDAGTVGRSTSARDGVFAAEEMIGDQGGRCKVTVVDGKVLASVHEPVVRP